MELATSSKQTIKNIKFNERGDAYKDEIFIENGGDTGEQS